MRLETINVGHANVHYLALSKMGTVLHIATVSVIPVTGKILKMNYGEVFNG